MRGPELARVAPGAEIFAGLQRRDRDRGGEHRYVHLPARLAVAHPRQQRGDGVGGVEAGREIHQRHTGLDRGPIGLAGDTHHTGTGLDGEVEAAFGATRAVLSEGRDRAIHQRRLARTEPVPAQTQALHRAGPAVLYQHIGIQHQLPAQVALLRVFQIQQHRLLAPVDGREVLAEALAQRRPLPHRVAFGRFDLDDPGTEVRQQHAAERARRHMAELDHLDAVQRLNRYHHVVSREAWMAP